MLHASLTLSLAYCCGVDLFALLSFQFTIVGSLMGFVSLSLQQRKRKGKKK